MNNEQLQRWALIAEILGSVAILITLVFLILQINVGVKATRAQTTQALFSQLQDAGQPISENQVLSRQWNEFVQNGYANLGQVEAGTVTASLARIMQV